GDDDAADTIVGLKGIERLADVLDHLRIERVERRRPIEPDNANAVFAFDDDGFVGHGVLLFDGVRSDRRLALADRAIEGRTASLGLATHPAAAALLRTRQAAAAVNGKLILKAADLAVGLLIVSQGRAAGADGIAQHGFDGGGEAPSCRRRLAVR